MGDLPYRVGNHAPINVWHAGREHVCTASSPEWAARVVEALIAHTTEPPPDSDLRTRVALVLHDVECGCPDRDLPIHDDALRGRWFATADKIMAAITAFLAYERATKQGGIRLFWLPEFGEDEEIELGEPIVHNRHDGRFVLRPAAPDTEATEQVPRCGEAGHNREFCDEPVPDGFCSEHGEVGASVARATGDGTPAEDKP